MILEECHKVKSGYYIINGRDCKALAKLRQSPITSQDIRKSILAKWHDDFSRYGDLFSSNSISGSTPPSVFVGSYNYPKVFAGPMVPPIHGDTVLFDRPEKWTGKTLADIVNFRLNMIRGIKNVSIHDTESRYVEDLQDIAMSSKSIDSDLVFHKTVSRTVLADDQNAPFGPVGEIKDARFSGTSSVKPIEKVFYDKSLRSREAVLALYKSGIDVSGIQRCFSMGMLGQKRILVPTKWSITATDDIISKSLISEILDFPVIDSCRVFSYAHLGNLFSVVLFPHRWLYEITEAWHSGDILGFGSDFENARGIDHRPSTAGAYFAARLGVAEYLHKKKTQSGAIVLREICPEYAIPVGVWQIREGIRNAMKDKPLIADDFDHALVLASQNMSISKSEWLLHGNIAKLVKQKTISDYF